jgi:phage gp36-like protein
VTFSVEAEAHSLYATRRHLHLAHVKAKVFENEDAEAIAEALLGATSDAEDALNANFPLPLESWPNSLRDRCAAIAKYRLFSLRGFQPQTTDELIVKDHDDAQKWLRMVGERKLVPPGLVPRPVEAIRTSSGDPELPDNFIPRMSDNWGDFG